MKTFLLIAHGSRSDRWNDEIRAFHLHLQEAMSEKTDFDLSRYCFLEYAEPSIPKAIKQLCDEGAREIVMLPLFLSMSEHVINDIPLAVQSVATHVGDEEQASIYQRKDTRISMLTPISAAELLARNLARRFNRINDLPQGSSILLVYYGTQRYMESWETLCRDTWVALSGHLPGHNIFWEYGGDAVGFSPHPISQKIREMTLSSPAVVILPALVSVGVIQEDVIPLAIRESGMSERVIYLSDAVLPDPDLAKDIVASLL